MKPVAFLPTFLYIFLLSTISSVFAAPIPPNTPLISIVYEFPNNTWVENLAVRANGKILTTLITSPQVWEIDPSTKTAQLIYTFPHAASALGIGEFSPDVFAVAVGNWSDVTGTATPRSWSIWVVDLSGSKGHGALVHKATDISEAQFLNGMTVLPTLPDTVLVGDADKGVIWRVNAVTGEYGVVIANEDLKPNTTAVRELGVNGIRYQDGYVHFVNTFKKPLYSRIPVHANGTPSGPIEVILPAATFPLNAGGAQADDFALDQDGNAWITNPSDTLFKVTLEGDAKVIAGGANSTALLGCTSAAFGRTRKDRKTLYITSDGGLAAPPPGGVKPGKLWAIDTSNL